VAVEEASAAVSHEDRVVDSNPASGLPGTTRGTGAEAKVP
jgi:hypothetical protein